MGYANRLSREYVRWSRILVVVSVWVVLALGDERGFAQEQITDQVSVTVFRNRLIGVSPGEGLVRVPLSAGEEILSMDGHGLNALVQTSTRLLGFSGPLVRWVEQRTDFSEQVIAWQATPRLIFVQTTRHLYGFQGELARWKTQELGTREQVRCVIVKDHVVVVTTNRRALAFSAFTGGFYTQDLRSDESIIEVEAKDNVVILSTQTRQLIFRSGLAIWAELR